ncbi:ATP-binding protein, partial [Streptomyces olivochromogenes]|uniref:ATP-binding protein n=1 Tax=Streptomyces olivochromogenes TaxID=1963 RepID=UPI001F276B52
PDLAVFAGRRAELAELTELAGTAGTILITGMPGIGKTALAVRWAHAAAPRFPDGQLHIELRGFDPEGRPPAAVDVLRCVLAALGVPPDRVPDGLDARTRLYRTLLAKRRFLVLLDDAADAEQVRPLLPASPGCLALVTSRVRLPELVASGARPLRLDLPSTADALASLALRVGAERLAAEPGAADELVARSGRLPLALAVVAARAVARPDFPLAAIATELRHHADTLDAFASAAGCADPRVAFTGSYRRLSPRAADLFRLLPRHPGPDLTVAGAAALAGLPPDEVGPALRELADAHLVTEHPPGHYTLHDLLRVLAAELTALHEAAP